MSNKKIISLAVILISVLSGLFFLVLFSSIRCEPDDMIISLEIRDGSFFKALVDRYKFYSFRPTYTVGSFATIGYSANTANYPFSIFIFFTSVYTLFLFSIYNLLLEVFSFKKLTRFDKWQLASFSNLLIMCLFFLTTERIEIFAWVSASIIHLVPVVFLVFSAWLILKENKKTDYVLLVTASTIVAGGAEHIAASALTTFLIVLAIAFFINRKNKNFYPENKTRIIKGVFFASVLGAFLLLCISNPGVGIHYIEVHQQSDGFAAHHSVNVLDTINMFCKPHKLIGLALLIACWVLFQNTFKISPIKIHSNYFLSAIFCVAAITAIASILAYHTLSVGRIWFAFDVTVFVVLCVLAIKWVESLKANTITLFVSAGVLLITLALFDIRHVPALLKFSSQHDKLVYSLQQKPAGEQVVLHDFPNPDLTNQVALSADPNNDVNQLFCRFYNIKAKVSVKK